MTKPERDSDTMNLPEVQAVVLDIFREVVRLLENNDIEYFLIGGGCLGIVRHRGQFVPWDDDLDIAVWVGDMPRLVDAMAGLPDHLSVRRKARTHNPTLHIVDRRTRITGGDPGTVDSVFVDVVPMMHWRTRGWKTLDNRAWKLRHTRPVPGRPWLENLPKALFVGFGIRRLVIFMLERLAYPVFLRLDRRLRATRGGVISGAFGRRWVGFFDHDVIYPLVRGTFCGVEVRVANDLHRFLHLRYGPNYMDIPDAGARWVHLTGAVWVSGK